MYQNKRKKTQILKSQNFKMITCNFKPNMNILFKEIKLENIWELEKKPLKVA